MPLQNFHKKNNESQRKTRKKQAFWFGILAELQATLLLKLKGYRILARRFKTPLGEIDLIAYKTGTVIFVEVKGRKKQHHALEALTLRQFQRIVKAAQFWISQNPLSATFRFDLIAVSYWSLPLHLQNITLSSFSSPKL